MGRRASWLRLCRRLRRRRLDYTLLYKRTVAIAKKCVVSGALPQAALREGWDADARPTLPGSTALAPDLWGAGRASERVPFMRPLTGLTVAFFRAPVFERSAEAAFFSQA